MPIKVKAAGAWGFAKYIKVRQGGQWTTAKGLWVKHAGVWVQTWWRLVIVTNKASVSGYDSTLNGQPSSKYVATDSVSAAVTVGVWPFAYQWEQVSGPAMLIGAATAASTSFGATCALNEFKVGQFRCRITDAHGQVGYSPTVTAQVQYMDGT